jgi:hypothetical protein
VSDEQLVYGSYWPRSFALVKHLVSRVGGSPEDISWYRYEDLGIDEDRARQYAPSLLKKHLPMGFAVPSEANTVINYLSWRILTGDLSVLHYLMVTASTLSGRMPLPLESVTSLKEEMRGADNAMGGWGWVPGELWEQEFRLRHDASRSRDLLRWLLGRLDLLARYVPRSWVTETALCERLRRFDTLSITREGAGWLDYRYHPVERAVILPTMVAFFNWYRDGSPADGSGSQLFSLTDYMAMSVIALGEACHEPGVTSRGGIFGGPHDADAELLIGPATVEVRP